MSDYLLIEHPEINNSQIETVTLNFRVERTWLEENGIGDVVLTKFINNEWVDLVTRFISSDERYHYFEADSDGLSVFAVVLKEVSVEAPVEQQVVQPEKGFFLSTLFTVAIATILATTGIGYIYRNRLMVGAKIEDLLVRLRIEREERSKRKRR